MLSSPVEKSAMAIAAMVAIMAYSIPDAPLLQCKKEINLHHVLMVNLFNKNIATYLIITYLDDGICHGEYPILVKGHTVLHCYLVTNHS